MAAEILRWFGLAIVLSCLFCDDVAGKATSRRVKRADDELHMLGIDHVDIIGTRLVNEHHEIFDYPGSHEKSDESSDDKDYHNPIYDHVIADKDDYSAFGADSSDSHDKSSDKSDDKSHDKYKSDSSHDSHDESHEDGLF